MSAQHTPGPWNGCNDCKCPCGAIWNGTGEVHIATAFDETAIGMEAFGSDIGVSRTERIANARLIVAAPDLLEALEAIVAALQDRWPHAKLDATERFGTPITKARAAIAKAKGEA